MDNIEEKLSEYIDKLNAEKKPEEHESSIDSHELEKLIDTVRMVRSLKEPALPKKDYPKRIAGTVAAGISGRTPVRKPIRAWLVSVAAVAAGIALVVMLNLVLPLNNSNIVYAMEQAFQGVKAYHGILEVVETNAEGKASTQGKLEVWADKEGRYFVKVLDGSEEGLITVNNGQKKWQLRPDEKEAYLFSAFPDPYRFTFELGKEVEKAKNALKSETVGEDTIAGRKATVLEVSPKGGVPYKLWIDKETSLPLQKQSKLQNAIQYKVTYTEIDFSSVIPKELLTYSIPDNFKEIDTNPERIVTSLEEAQEIVGFSSKLHGIIPAGYSKEGIAVGTESKVLKLNFVTEGSTKKVVVFESKAVNEFKPSSAAVLGKIGESTVEVQSPIQESLGILGGGGPYAGVTDMSSIRWQKDGFEYAVVGNVPVEEMVEFIKGLKLGEIQIPTDDTKTSKKPQIEVPIDLEVEKGDQKNADSGHSPWKLDPVFVAQVFASLKVSPEGINGEYPIKTEELRVIQNSGEDAIIEVTGDKTLVSRVYLKRLIRQDSTGIWTVVGYDTVDK